MPSPFTQPLDDDPALADAALAVERVCYSSVFATASDPWQWLHFAGGLLLQLYVDEWRTAILITYLWETFEAWYLSIFSLQEVFGVAAASDFETCNGQLVGDVVGNLSGVATAAVLRWLWGRQRLPGLLWWRSRRPYRGSFWWWANLRTVMQWALTMSAAFLSIGLRSWITPRLEMGQLDWGLLMVHGVLALLALVVVWREQAEGWPMFTVLAVLWITSVHYMFVVPYALLWFIVIILVLGALTLPLLIHVQERRRSYGGVYKDRGSWRMQR